MNDAEIQKMFELIDTFPSGDVIFPFKMYSSWDEYYADINKPPIKTEYENLGQLDSRFSRTDVCKASLIVYKKYKHSYDLQFSVLRELQVFCLQFKQNRELNGKKCSFDFLVQSCSQYLKERYETN